ncbi:MAG: hypothetical protein OEY19_10165 [Gammaproteobacteria bacterium]|nr:hypothetical protein [Gammaproteobacteria bacterium]
MLNIGDVKIQRMDKSALVKDKQVNQSAASSASRPVEQAKIKQQKSDPEKHKNKRKAKQLKKELISDVTYDNKGHLTDSTHVDVKV